MIKNKLDFKLINTVLIMLIIFLIYNTGNLWIGVLSKIWGIIFPFFIAFIIAYALYPFLQYLRKHKIPKTISIFIIIGILIAIVCFIIFAVIPMIFGELPNLFNGIISFLKEISSKLDINISPIQNSLQDSFNEIIVGISKIVSNGAINMIGVSINYLSGVFIAFAASIYLLSDMDKIRKNVKYFLKKKSKKMYHYVALLDKQMKNYLTGFTRIILITLFEYTLAYTIIGHPQALLLGFLAMMANLIPYFGGIITNCIAAITAFVISPSLFIKTVITFLILSTIDGYVINPFVYGKTNELHPLVVIISVFAGGALFGILGILISLPLAIIIITTIQYFKEDFKEAIVDMKERI